jgi:hypothetical protein
MTMYEMVKDDPKFKAFCRRKVNGTAPRKTKFKVPIPKRLSIYSVLGDYTTGRLVRGGDWETLRMRKVGPYQFESENPWMLETIPQFEVKP